MNPSIEKILKLPTKQKIAVFVLTLLLIVGLFYMWLLKPKQEQLKELNGKLKDLQSQIQEDRKIADNLPGLQKEYDQLNRELEMALAELPLQKEIPNLLTSITSAGKGSGLDFLLFRPRSEEPKDFYAAVPVDITVYGTFRNVAKFMVEVSELPRIVNMSNVTFSEIKSVGNQTNVRVSCLATTFRFLDKKEIKDEKKAK